MKPNPDIIIRRGQTEDSVAIAGFNRSMARETEDIDLNLEVTAAGVRKMLRNPEMGFYLVAETGNSIVGALMVTTEWSDWRNGVFWWIQSVYVVNEYRRQGIYGRLYARVKELGEAAGDVCGYRLYVEKNNSVAQAAYRKLGMTETGYDMFEELISVRPS